jgi:hypothetical protein
VVDLDRDGRADLLSGSYMPGELHLFAGRAGGGFAPARVLADARGKPLRAGRASWPFACDWERDGDLDLVVGNMYGRVFLVRNGSGGAALAFAEPSPLLAAGAALVIEETNAAPCIADWDGDGDHDLLLGTGDGAVLFYRNTADPKAAGEPALAAPLELLPKSPDGPAVERLAHPGQRARVAVCDWNEDGRLDLVVGEHASEDGPARELTREEQRELDAAIRAGTELAARRGDLERAALARWLAEKNIPPARSSEHYDDFLGEWLKTPEARAVTERQKELAALQDRLNPALIEHGRVWVFLRKRA